MCVGLVGRVEDWFVLGIDCIGLGIIGCVVCVVC